jgi:hypothetical protein
MLTHYVATVTCASHKTFSAKWRTTDIIKPNLCPRLKHYARQRYTHICDITVDTRFIKSTFLWDVTPCSPVEVHLLDRKASETRNRNLVCYFGDWNTFQNSVSMSEIGWGHSDDRCGMVEDFNLTSVKSWNPRNRVASNMERQLSVLSPK